jgi:putative thiamine transport system ATP-binding protein
MLELHGVTVTLAGRRLLGPLDARIGPGEVLALMGPSGSGKSSLLSFLAGLLEPPLHGAGAVMLDGRAIGALPVEQRRMGLVFQDDLLFPHLTALENLLFALPAGPRRERVARAEAMLARAELAGLGTRLPAQLSGGQRARVSLLRALLAAPRALLLDEPFSRLDAALRGRMRAFTWALLAEHGVPAVLVTHDADDVPPGAHRVSIGGTP